MMKEVECNGVVYSIPEFIAFRCPSFDPNQCKGGQGDLPPNPWQVIHTRYADAIQFGRWEQLREKEWLSQDFPKLIPASCGCGERWSPLSDQIDLSTAETAFRSVWQAHNTVSTEHVKPAKAAISYERCRAIYLPQPPLGIAAVTSLSTKRLRRQTLCLDTWKSFGLSIHCVQAPDEIELLRIEYPMVDQWHAAEGSPPTIKQMASVACVLNAQILLINADIELRGEQRILRDAMADGVLVGVRHNYDSEWWKGEAEEWGIDAYSFTPDDAAKLPDIDFRIGKPVWDYWVLDYFKSHKLNWICEPLLFHKKHPLAWSDDDFAAGFKRLQGIQTSIDAPYGKQFRKSFPYPAA